MEALDEEGPISFSLQVYLAQPRSLACVKAPRRVVLEGLRTRGASCCGNGQQESEHSAPAPAAAQAGRSRCTRRWVKGCLKVGLTCKEMPFSPYIHLATFLKATKKTVVQ